MRKIRKFKISLHYKEILRRIKSAEVDLNAAGFTSESALAVFISSLHQAADTGVLYEFNEGSCLELVSAGFEHKGAFSLCLITLGKKLEEQLACITNMSQLTIANIAVYEFLRTALNFVIDLLKEEAEKDNLAPLNMELLSAPIFSYGVEPKFLREAKHLDITLVKKVLPDLLKRLEAQKINVSFEGDTLTPKATVAFVIPWVKKKGKK